ncbi:MAG: endolytic transglycosylase MltG [Thermonemataceae bacterium]
MRSRKVFTIIFVVTVILLATFSFYFYQMVKSPNFQVQKEAGYLYIPQEATFRTVLDSLKAKDMIHDITSFAFLSKLMKYQENVRPGRYLIPTDATNMEVVVLLRSGQQVPVQLQFSALRTKEQLAARISRQVALSEEALLNALNDPTVAQKYGFDTTTFMCMFLPNTYEVYWSTSLEQFLERMAEEYKKYWTTERVMEAEAVGLTPIEVTILASIVQAETAQEDEMPTIAGVYINRLERDQLLQADPTVIFAVGDFTIKRVLNVHLEVDSPYNTYRYKGLPPGPINLPAMAALNAVLNYEKHDYVYFCAKEDFSGYHNFAKSYQVHLQNARRYQRALQQRLQEN